MSLKNVLEAMKNIGSGGIHDVTRTVDVAATGGYLWTVTFASQLGNVPVSSGHRAATTDPSPPPAARARAAAYSHPPSTDSTHSFAHSLTIIDFLIPAPHPSLPLPQELKLADASALTGSGAKVDFNTVNDGKPSSIQGSSD